MWGVDRGRSGCSKMKQSNVNEARHANEMMGRSSAHIALLLLLVCGRILGVCPRSRRLCRVKAAITPARLDGGADGASGDAPLATGCDLSPMPFTLTRPHRAHRTGPQRIQSIEMGGIRSMYGAAQPSDPSDRRVSTPSSDRSPNTCTHTHRLVCCERGVAAGLLTERAGPYSFPPLHTTKANRSRTTAGGALGTMVRTQRAGSIARTIGEAAGDGMMHLCAPARHKVYTCTIDGLTSPPNSNPHRATSRGSS